MLGVGMVLVAVFIGAFPNYTLADLHLYTTMNFMQKPRWVHAWGWWVHMCGWIMTSLGVWVDDDVIGCVGVVGAYNFFMCGGGFVNQEVS